MPQRRPAHSACKRRSRRTCEGATSDSSLLLPSPDRNCRSPRAPAPGLFLCLCRPYECRHPQGATPMPTIRPARADEYDEIARVWMESWASTGLEDASNFLLAKLRARVPMEIEKGWSLFVADDRGKLAAMLALHLPLRYLDQLFVAPEYQGKSLGRELLAFTRTQLPDEIWLRCVRENEKAWRWYEREGFVFEKEQVDPANGLTIKYYRWKKDPMSAP